MNDILYAVRCCSAARAVLAMISALMFWPPSVAPAATYYVDGSSPAAHDANPGTETQPWRSIGKAASSARAGDTVFVKEGTYRETMILSRSGTSAKPITFAVYPGHEGRAIINAAELVTSWTLCAGPADCAGNPNWSHVYYADVAGFVAAHPDGEFGIRQVFQHGQRLARSRFPNEGWSYPTTVVDAKTVFEDRTLSQPRSYFDGAVCHIKTAMWRIDQVPIASSNGKRITLAKSPNPWHDLSTRFGYYITSVVGEIDAEGEWAYDAPRKRLYLWPRGDSPDGVEFTYREYCVRTYDRVSFTILRGLTLRYPYQYGIWLYLANNMTLESNTIEHAFTFGVHLQSTGGPCDDNQIVRNTIKYSGYRAINVGDQAARCNIEGNYTHATGVEHFAGDLMNGPSEGIYIAGPSARVYNNRIDRVGNVGLYLHGEARDREVSYNYITNTGLALADTAGLYTGGFAPGPERDYIHHNIIMDSFGCRTMDRQFDVGIPPTVEAYSGDASGIYIDEEGNHRVIEHNTVIGSRFAGIFFHWAPDNLVQKNTLYGNRVAQVYLSGKDAPRTRLVDDLFSDNILFATSGSQRTLYMGLNYDDVHFGGSDGNYFCNPHTNQHIHVSRYVSGPGGTVTVAQEDMTLAGWRTLSGYDEDSQEFGHLDRIAGITIPRPVKARVVCNVTRNVTTVDLGANTYCDVEGNKVYGRVILWPFESKILIPASYSIPAAP